MSEIQKPDSRTNWPRLSDESEAYIASLSQESLNSIRQYGMKVVQIKEPAPPRRTLQLILDRIASACFRRPS